MTLSLLTSIELVSTDVVNNIDRFDNAKHMTYTAGIELEYQDYIYQNVGETLIIPSYQAGVTYHVGDIIYKDNMVQKVVSFGLNQSEKQPWNYTAVDTSKDASTWTHRWHQVSSNMPVDYSYLTGDYLHVFYSGFKSSKNFISGWLTTPNISDDVEFFHKADAFDNINDETLIVNADFMGADAYVFKTFIFNGNDVYARTHVDATIEYEPATGDITTTPVTNLADIPSFAKIRPSNRHAPLDDKHYSVAKSTDSMTYRVDVLGRFDTLSLSGIIGDTVDVTFRDSAGATVDTITGYVIDNSRDVGNVLSDYKTTSILYSDVIVEAGGSVEFTVHGTLVELGSIMCGLKVNAGFTNLAFSNSFLDHSPKNVDSWGNVEYIEGVKVNVFDGTVDVPITTYDKMTRLMESIGGSTVILNGSDSVDNSMPDSESIFASTMLIGRMSNFKLQTKLDKKRIGDLATYSIKLTELT